MTWAERRRRPDPRDESAPPIRFSDDRKVLTPLRLIISAVVTAFVLGGGYVRAELKLASLEAKLEEHGVALKEVNDKVDTLKDSVRAVQISEAAASGKLDLLLSLRGVGGRAGTASSAPVMADTRR